MAATMLRPSADMPSGIVRFGVAEDESYPTYSLTLDALEEVDTFDSLFRDEGGRDGLARVVLEDALGMSMAPEVDPAYLNLLRDAIRAQDRRAVVMLWDGMAPYSWNATLNWDRVWTRPMYEWLIFCVRRPRLVVRRVGRRVVDVAEGQRRAGDRRARRAGRRMLRRALRRRLQGRRLGVGQRQSRALDRPSRFHRLDGRLDGHALCKVVERKARWRPGRRCRPRQRLDGRVRRGFRDSFLGLLRRFDRWRRDCLDGRVGPVHGHRVGHVWVQG